MRRVEIKEWNDYVKATEILVRVGGTWLGRPTQVLIVNEAQYQALLEAKLVPPDAKEANSGGKKTKKRTNA